MTTTITTVNESVDDSCELARAKPKENLIMARLKTDHEQ